MIEVITVSENAKQKIDGEITHSMILVFRRKRIECNILSNVELAPTAPSIEKN